MERGNESCSTARAPTLGAVSPGLSGADQFPVRLGVATVTDILTNDEISLLRSLEKKSRTITGNFTHNRYDRLETKGYIKRSLRSQSVQDMPYEITDAWKAALRLRVAPRVDKNKNHLAFRFIGQHKSRTSARWFPVRREMMLPGDGAPGTARRSPASAV